MKKLLLLSLACCCTLVMHSQTYDPQQIDKKLIMMLDEARTHAQEGYEDQALTIAQKTVDENPKFLDGWLMIANLYSVGKQHTESVKAFEKAFAIDSVYAFEYKLIYASNLAGIGEFEKALQITNQMLAVERLNPNTRRSAEAKKRTFEFAVANTNPGGKNYVFAPQNIGPSINTSESEYFPSLTIDNKELVFTRKVGHVNEDFFQSRRTGAGWEMAKPMEGDVNTAQNEGALSISQDGQWLVFTACDRR